MHPTGAYLMGAAIAFALIALPAPRRTISACLAKGKVLLRRKRR